MTTWKTLALSGAVLSLAVTGWAYAQTPAPAAPPANAPVQAPMADEDAVPPADDLGDVADDEIEMDGAETEGDAAEAAPEPDRDGPGRPGPRGDRMGRMDADRNGSIEKSEFLGERTERLRAADTNGDGTLSGDELQAMVMKEMAERRARRLERRLDVDGNGTVTLAEIESMRAKQFAIMDRNDDGRVDGRELRRMHRDMGAGDMGRREMRGGEGRDGRHGERSGRHGGEGRHHHHGGHGGDR